MKAKFPEIVKLIERRLSEGDYSLNAVPGSRKLAAEVGVSYLTARRAVAKLIDDGLLVRQSNGRVVVNTHTKRQQIQFAYLTPAWGSGISELQATLEQVAAEFNINLRPVDFVHWDDPVVVDVLSKFDGIFIMPSSEAVPERVLQALRNSANPVLILSQNWNSRGLASVEYFSYASISKLLQYLYDMGHRKIGCLNVIRDAETDQRIQMWRNWLADHNMVGVLIDAPVSPFTISTHKAYRIMSETLDSATFDGTALLCTTFPAAVGAARAFHDHGMIIGKDISICAVDGESVARYQMPSITSLEITDFRKSLTSFIKYMLARRAGRPATGLMAPQVDLFIGESTGVPHLRS